MTYAKFTNENQITKAPDNITTTQGVFAPSSEQYQTEITRLGYKPFDDSPQPEAVEGYHWQKNYVDGDTITVEWVSIEIPQPTQEELIKALEMGVQAHIVETAQTKGYDDDKSLLSYLNSSVEKWQKEATIFLAWRDAVWQKCHELLATLTEIPTIEELIAQLPQIDWNDTPNP